MKSWFVYMVRCQSGALYTGITNDLDKRLKAHNSGKGAKAIRALGSPVKLEWYNNRLGKSSAMRYEIFIKNLSKHEKEKLIQTSNFHFTIH